jgi:transcriptional regulator with XRE-family HTH domain
LRRRSRLTQQELAKLMDLDDSTVSKHEAGERSLDSDIISRYAKVFKCQSFELFVRPEKPTIFYG